MYYKEFYVAGVLNTTRYDAGLMSTVGEPVHLNAIHISTSAWEGNHIEGWIGTKRVLEIPDYCLDTQEETAGQAPISSVKMGRVPIELDIPAGQLFRIAVRSGGVASNLFGSYEYQPQS